MNSPRSLLYRPANINKVNKFEVLICIMKYQYKFLGFLAK